MKRYVVVGLIALVFVLVLAMPFLAASGPACGGCHAMRSYATAAEKSVSHSSITCVSCHASPGPLGSYRFGVEVSTVMLAGTLSGSAPARAVSAHSDAGCLKCHEAVLEARVGAKGLRVRHESCAQGRLCQDCHGGTGHLNATRWKRSYVMEECVECHVRERATTKCDRCHDDRTERERLKNGPWQVTHGREWRNTHGMGSVRYCSTCHPSDYCVRCHATPLPHSDDWGREHAAASRSAAGAKCGTCHKTRDLCDSCHGIQMPHPKGFLKVHRKVAASNSDPSCTRRCHATDDCVKCHTYHVHPGFAGEAPKGGVPFEPQ